MPFARIAVAPSPEALADEQRRISLVRVGDEGAMGVLIAHHRKRLIGVAANILRDKHEAEDVAQEAFLKAFREIGKLRDDRAFAGFLYRITVRLCLDRLRTRRAEPLDVDHVQPSQGPQVEAKVVVEQLLTRLSDELRTTLVLREIEQMSYEEVAEAMQVPVGTVRSRLHTARERFRQLYLESVGDKS